MRLGSHWCFASAQLAITIITEKNRQAEESVSSIFPTMEIDSVIDLTQSEEGNKTIAMPLNTAYTLVQHYKKKKQLLFTL